jgi:hypothetical protein
MLIIENHLHTQMEWISSSDYEIKSQTKQTFLLSMDLNFSLISGSIHILDPQNDDFCLRSIHFITLSESNRILKDLISKCAILFYANNVLQKGFDDSH